MITNLFTASRGGVISVVVFFLVLLTFRRARRQGAILSVAVIVLAWQLAPPFFWERLGELGTEPEVRLAILWPAGRDAFLRNPLLGSGLGTNALTLSRVLLYLTSVHSAPLAIAIEVGLPGLLIYLSFMAIPVFHLWNAIKAFDSQGRTDLSKLAEVVVATFVAFLASWIKGGGLEYSKVLWLLLGLMAVLSTMAEPYTAGRFSNDP